MENTFKAPSFAMSGVYPVVVQGACFKRLRDFEMHNPRRQAVENAHTAFDATSSDFYIKRSHQVRTTGRKGWIRLNPMDWHGRHRLLSNPSLPVLASITQPKGFLKCGLALQKLKFFAHSVKHMRTAHVTFL